jgi:hypothetical protein
VLALEIATGPVDAAQAALAAGAVEPQALPDDWPEPVADSGEVIVAVRAVSLNGFDPMVLRGHRRAQDAAADDPRRRPCRGGRRPRPRHRGSGLAERLGDLDAQRVPG